MSLRGVLVALWDCTEDDLSVVPCWTYQNYLILNKTLWACGISPGSREVHPRQQLGALPQAQSKYCDFPGLVRPPACKGFSWAPLCKHRRWAPSLASSGESAPACSRLQEAPQRATTLLGTSAQTRKSQTVLNKEWWTVWALPAGRDIFWHRRFCARSCLAPLHYQRWCLHINTMFLLGFSPWLWNTGKTVSWSDLQSPSKQSGNSSEHTDGPPKNNRFCKIIKTGLRCLLLERHANERATQLLKH